MDVKATRKICFITAAAALIACTSALADLQQGERYFAQGQYALALTELQPLAKRGNAAAAFYLGVMYMEGRGVSQNVSSGIKLLHSSAEGGDSGAMLRLGRIYYDGQLHSQDLQKAASYTRAAAEKGLGEAAVFLGALYFRGAGVPKDPSTALALFRDAADTLEKAVRNGSALPAALSDARNATRALESKLTGEQISEAERIGRRWRSDKWLPGDDIQNVR